MSPALRTAALMSLLVAGDAFVLAGEASAGVEVEVEASIVAASRNDTRIPGDTGTRISLVDDLSTAAAPAFRLRLGYRVHERHLISALYAPLQVTARGSVSGNVEFMGATYPARTPLLAIYRFNSYRLTYRYSIVWQDGLDVAVGFTAKIRDAETSLYGVEARRKTNIGFVPLLNAHVAWRPGQGAFGVVLDVDALAAPQGRAADVLLAGTWSFREDLELRAGYRTVEGGADNDEVYSFAWLHYGTIGLKMSL
ncbi:MAG: hypothetical protein IPK13_28065 [Deltaproteobacteria bacterium]|nr:hypothetical protein [Deltaproteobacteria bacterium]